MNFSIKNNKNWISFTVCALGFFFTILGTSMGIIPLLVSILDQGDLIGSYLSVLFVVYAFILQGMILVILYQHIKNKSKIKKSKNTELLIINLSLYSLIFLLMSGILVSAERVLPMVGQFLFFFPITILIGGLFFNDYKILEQVKEKKRISALLFIPIILIVIIIITNYIFNPSFKHFFTKLLRTFSVDFLIEFLLLLFIPSVLISFIIISVISLSRSQLLPNKRNLILTSSIISSVAAFFLPNSLIIAIVLSIIISFILKYIYMKRIPTGQVQELTVSEQGKIMLEVNNLKVYYQLTKGVLKREIGAVKAVDGISFKIKAGETLGLVGESGCGKTTVANCILGLIEKEDGEILFKDQPVSTPYPTYLRKKIQTVFQDPDASLNPRMKVIDIVAEPLKNLMGITKDEDIRKMVLILLEKVSLNVEHLDRFPHEFSGGQKQRIIIARALASNPELIILDEPTSALDVSVQAQILNLLKRLQKQYGYGYLFITHDLSVVNHIAYRVAVMYVGQIVEIGNVDQIFNNPLHPYTKALLKSRMEVVPDDPEIKFILEGEVPSPINPPSGCRFHPRCKYRFRPCDSIIPKTIEVKSNCCVACHLYDPEYNNEQGALEE